MAGRHLHGAGTEAELHVVIRHDGQAAPDERQDGMLADKVPIALILRIHGDAGVAQHGFGTRGGDDKLLLGVLDRITDIPEGAWNILIFDLRVREGGAAVRAPVDDAAALIDQTLLVEPTEGLAHGLGAGLVHGEAAAIPVTGNAHALLLLDDAVAVLFLPFPDALEELVAPEVVASKALLLTEHLLDLDLRGDAGVIDAGEPERGIALHPLVARENVLQRCVKGVPHVQLPRDIRGRHHDGEGLLLRIDLALEPAALHPEIVDLLLDLLGFIHFRKFFHAVLLYPHLISFSFSPVFSARKAPKAAGSPSVKQRSGRIVA